MATFNFIDGYQFYDVPAGQQWHKVRLAGAAGGDWNRLGGNVRSGRGCIFEAYAKFTPGERLHVHVGCKPGSNYQGREGHVYGGGGMGAQYYNGYRGGNGGGGSSDIRRGGNGFEHRIMVAGGGGGIGTRWGGYGDSKGGDAGAPNQQFAPGVLGQGEHPQRINNYWWTQPGSWTRGGFRNADPGAGMNSMGEEGGLHYGGRFGWSGEASTDNGGGGGGGLYGGAGGAVPDERAGELYVGGGAGGAGGSSSITYGHLLGVWITDQGNAGAGQIVIDPYVTPAPLISYPVTPHVAPRYAFRVDIRELHPNPSGVKTVTYELSQTADFTGADKIRKTVNFVSNGADGKLSTDPNIPSGANTLMNFWVSLLKTGTWYLRVHTGGNDGLNNSTWTSSSFTVTSYKQPTPTLSFPYPPTTSRRFAFQVNVGKTHPLGQPLTVAYDLSPTADFSAGVISKSVTFAANADDAAVAGDPAITDVTSGTAMNFWVTLPAQGTFHLRVRVSGADVVTSDYGTTNFNSGHQPAVAPISPSGSSYLKYVPTVPFRVNITDPWAGDRITAYQLVVERNDNGSVVVDTGKMPIADPAPLGQNTFNQAIGEVHKDLLLRWKLKVWDNTDVESLFTDYSLFTLVDAPSVAVASPSEGAQLTSGVPDFKWTVGLTAGRTLVSSTIIVREAATNSVIWERTVGAGVVAVTPETTILVNQVTYSVTIEVTDSAGLTNSDSNLFSTSYVSPDPLLYTIDASLLNTEGYIEVNWSNQAPDARLVEWRVYRRELPSNTWELMERISDEGTKHYRDYLVRSGSSYMYTVSQLADRSGALLESPVGTRMTQSGNQAESQINPVAINNYWLIAPDRPELTVMLTNVTNAGETEEYDRETFTIIGRGRHVDYGDRLGWSGTLEVQIRQAERSSLLKARIEALRAAQETYWLRTPFGRLFPVALGNLGWDPLAGTGTMEMGDMSIPYEEVG